MHCPVGSFHTNGVWREASTDQWDRRAAPAAYHHLRGSHPHDVQTLHRRHGVVPTDPIQLYLKLAESNSGPESLWFHQGKVLEDWHDNHSGNSSRDVAIELPTRAGKTLVGGLIGEYRRRAHRDRVACLCPTRQLARQSAAKLTEYGIENVLLTRASWVVQTRNRPMVTCVGPGPASQADWGRSATPCGGTVMEFQLLGPLSVHDDGKSRSFGGAKISTLAALLALDAGRVVSVDSAISALWGESPPASARGLVQTYVCALRRALTDRPDVLVRRAPGYCLEIALDRVDALRFERDVRDGRQSFDDGEHERAGVILRAALATWRGSALGGTAGDWAEIEAARLEELRLQALELRVAADFARGRGADQVPELTTLVSEHPTREHLRARLILALHESGRRADAVNCYREARRILHDELGVEPGLQLQAAIRIVQRRVDLRFDKREDPPAPAPAAAGPRQLPPTVAQFTGRQAEVEQLRRLLMTERVRVCCVSGKPGVGKTELAVHVAHQVHSHFPDGQLHASLRDHDGAPVRSTDVLARFLCALGVPVEQMPNDVERRAGLFRSMLAHRRVLVMLDDVSDEAQMRQLIPAGDGCSVVATSRSRMSALDGAAHIDLSEPTAGDGLTLFEGIVGSDRTAAEPAAAAEIVRLCGRLPLALRIAGARLAARPHWTLAGLAGRLCDHRRVLDELTVSDLQMRRRLDLSYRRLPPIERTALRRLSLAGAADFASSLASALLDVDDAEAEEAVEGLVDARLLDVLGATQPSRYRFHRLTRAYAAERLKAEDQREQLLASVRRVRSRWLEVTSQVPEADLDVAWIASEREVMANVSRQAADLGLLPTDLVLPRSATPPSCW